MTYERHSDMCGCERCAVQWDSEHPQPVFGEVDDYDDEIDGDSCGNCGGEGFTYHCIDGCCVDAEEGCDLCASRCDWCNPPKRHPKQRFPHPSPDGND